MIAEFDSLLRIVTIGSGLMLLAMVVASEMRSAMKVPCAGMLIGATGYLLDAQPMMLRPALADPLIDLVAMSTPLWIWLFTRRLFERGPDDRAAAIAAGAIGLGWVLANFVPATSPSGLLILYGIALALVIDLLRIGMLERGDDLIEQRRNIRLWLPLMVAVLAAHILIFEVFRMAMGLDDRYPLAQLFTSLMIFLIILFAGLALFRADPELLLETQDNRHRDAPLEPLDHSPAQAALHQKLTAAMEDGLYREAGLTIAALAQHLDTPEHRLRALLNQRLGYRNFSAFLNRHRIAEARAKLADLDYVDTPMLTLAMDLGYNSLPSFNRAFRSETGTTPTDHRRLSLPDSTAQN